ncbi:MAG: 30S ribosomal protein S17 [Chloroflexi bacterium]|nr:30S ribosomal protein S17 [Chloroflexota bacterium]
MSMTNQKSRMGTVTSTKMQKTVIVSVTWRQRHLLYGKAVRRITKFYAHDDKGECKLGDVVRIVEARPLSKSKRWRVIEIVKRGEVPEVKPGEIGVPVIETPSAAAAAIEPAAV